MATAQPTQSHWTAGRIFDLAISSLAVVFLAVLLIQTFGDPTPRTNRRLNLVSTTIWMIFAADFFVRLAFAPDRKAFLRHNWITAVALFLPMLRVLRIVQIAKAAPSVPAAGLLEGTRRGTVELRHAFGARPALYIGVLTLVLIALSTVGMYAIERDSHRQPNITNLGDALWWTMATLTTIGSELYPVTWEGRALAILVMIYSVGFAGYVTGSFVTLLLGAPQQHQPQPQPAEAALRDEIRALRAQLAALGPSTAPQSVQAATSDADEAETDATETTPHETAPAPPSTVGPRT